MLCLRDYIGLRDCSQGEPASGLWVNDLPGISTELAEKSANREQVNFLGLWESTQAGAWERLRADVVAGLVSVNFNQTIYQTERPVLVKPFAWRDESTGSRGVILRSPVSRYSELVISGVYAYAQTGVETEVFVLDLQTQAVLATEAVVLVSGWNAVAIKPVRVELSTGLQEVYVGVEPVPGLTLAEMTPRGLTISSPSGRDCGCGDVRELGVNFARLDDNFVALPSPGNPVVGVQAEFRCSLDRFICEHREAFKTVLWYSLGESLLQWKLNSYRMNAFTASLLEKTEKTAAGYLGNYQSTLKQVLKTIPLGGSGLCFDCKDVRWVEYGGMMP